MTTPESKIPHSPRWLVGVVVVGLILVMAVLAWLRKRSEWDFSVHPVENPTEQVFQASVEDVLHAICAESFFEQVSKPLRRDDEALELVKHLDPDVDFLAVADDDDVLLWSDHQPITQSLVYQKSGEPVPLVADYFLQVIPLDDQQTRIQVKPIYTEIITGQGLAFLNPQGSPNNYRRVPSTTVEEYQVLLEIGRRLGTEDMAPLVLPEVVPETQNETGARPPD